MGFEVDQAAQVLPDPDPGVVVVVPVLPARSLPIMLRELPAVVGPERVVSLANQARIRFHAAA